MRKSNVIVSCAALLTLFAPTANAVGLGAASNYEIFTFGNLTQSSVDTNGAVAVGGSASLTNFGLNASGTSLVVGGSLNYTNGTNNGSTIVGGSVTASGEAFNGSLAANGSIALGYGTVTGPITYGGNFSAPQWSGLTGTQGTTALPVNFASAYTATNSMSQSLFNTAANGTAALNYSTLTLTGTSNTQNVFNISGSQLKNLSTMQFNVPAGSTVVINVTGTNVEVGNFGTTWNSTDPEHVVYNFAQATNLTLDGSFNGTLLADNASITTGSGQLDGQVIAGNLNGNIETHNEYAFDGNLSFNPNSNGNGTGSITNTPEVSPFLTAGFGLMSMGVFKRRSRKRA